jgi:hypothetical protein
VDRLFAFQTLKCSDMPVLRDQAMRLGLQNSQDDAVRAQIVMDTVMAKPSLKVALIASPDLSQEGKDYIKRTNGALYYENNFSDPRRVHKLPLATRLPSRGGDVFQGHVRYVP